MIVKVQHFYIPVCESSVTFRAMEWGYVQHVEVKCSVHWYFELSLLSFVPNFPDPGGKIIAV